VAGVFIDHAQSNFVEVIVYALNEVILLFVSSDDSQATKGFSQVTLILPADLLDTSRTFFFARRGVVLQFAQEIEVHGNCNDHVGREVQGNSNLDEAVNHG